MADTLSYTGVVLSGRRGSNPRPLAWKANALPTELLPRSSFLSGDFRVGLRIFGQSFTEVNSFPHRLSVLNSSRNKLQTVFCLSFGRFPRWTSPEFVGVRLNLWEKMDSNHRRYKPADLQSAPFGHSGILPFFVSFGCLLRYASYPRSVIYTGKLLSSSLAFLESIPK